ncbi:MAG: ParB/RepB/Spo0J family partition protein [Defluviitaleaceae bacterium]|nr:ParB/RepB/Spo0J family partition protein [Defluviitaleaceae bacterium]
MGKPILGNNALAGFDNIFRSTAKTDGAIETDETIVYIPLEELYPPEFHPFQVNDDETMTRLVKSVKQHGVREPGLARPHSGGYGYELLAGNRRKRACELAGLATMPVIIRTMDDDSAEIAMVDSNLQQREKLLFSEKAWAYRVKMEALNHNGIKGEKLSVEVLMEQTGESKSQIFRYISLTELVVDLLDKVDNRQLAFNPAVELSYLSQTEQCEVVAAMELYDIKPSLSQAVQLKKLKQDGALTKELIYSILSESKPKINHHEKISTHFRRYFPADYSLRQMNDVIAGLLETWQSEQAAQEGSAENG